MGRLNKKKPPLKEEMLFKTNNSKDLDKFLEMSNTLIVF